MAEIKGNITIRPLDATDAEAYRTLRLQALLQAPEAFGASHAEEAARPPATFIARITPAPPSLVFGAFADAELVGIAGFLAGSSEKSRHRGMLWGVYLAPDWRGRGIARALVEAVVQHAAQHVLVLQARAVTTNSVALHLYERLGFKPYGIESKALRINDALFDEALLALDFSLPADD
ncbi:GNAT family N-acetyltransferase [Bosea psychrotolerans]|uniref:RimJ/RimL family protein N-acetyltransferase n=1 Tax=Bosea psychrotolerans TaxID=1871628 RepID=A0A2S4MRC0_9HYPH|nr:GNAT family N-acetyltransferase [Bosea psychrotolerans]POR56827.1 RimJ/RimL family protein N-acetyltransferase [Bosea psychrotolerans]